MGFNSGFKGLMTECAIFEGQSNQFSSTTLTMKLSRI